MSSYQSDPKTQNRLHRWLITCSVIFFSIFSVILALITIYSMPDHSVKPLMGAVFYASGAILIVFFLLLNWKKEIALIEPNLLTDRLLSQNFTIRESISDKILKWVAAIFIMFFVFDGFVIALICIYSLPDKTVQPITGLMYSISGSIPIGVFVFVAWKNWISQNGGNSR